MIWQTKKEAYASLREFTPAMRKLHRVIVATVNGTPVGWTRVMVSK